jgi:endonuclease/exonuclease/phosphatase family metal-dependent hydrolase
VATTKKRATSTSVAVPSILDPPPENVEADLRAVRSALEVVPPRQLERNLLIATFNIREFADLADVWDQPTDHKPMRDLHALRLLAEIVSRFDVVAIQEVGGNIKALRHMLRWLGGDWSLILTDVTRGKAAGGERIAFVFDIRRARLSGLACELVVPPEELAAAKASKDPEVLREQFARTPYAVAFQTGGITFVLISVHIIYGKSPKERTPEITAVANWLKSMATTLDGYGQNLIVLGDFNIDRREKDANYEALLSTGLKTPPELDDVARTVANEGDAGTFYDQVAWFPDNLNTLEYSGRAGRVDYKSVNILKDVAPQEYTFRMSDHYPLWTEFRTGEYFPR